MSECPQIPITQDGDDPWSLKLPEWLLHIGPLVLAICCLLWSLMDFSVYREFRERHPGTEFSVVLMGLCFMISFSAIRSRAVSSGKRWLAIVLSAGIGFGIADETRQWHEAIGRYVQEHLTLLPLRVTNYTDDVLILTGALVVGAFLAWSIWRLPDRRELVPYLCFAIVFGVMHGLLDISNHKDYVWRFFWPNMAKDTSYEMIQRLGCLEECTKLWCEWFVVLFLLKLFYNQRCSLVWPAMVWVGWLMAVGGMWAVAPGADSVPYLVIGGGLEYVRNYHLLITLAAIWGGWAVAAWWLIRYKQAKRNLLALFFLCPFPLILARQLSPEWFTAIVEWLDRCVVPEVYSVENTISLWLLIAMLILPALLVGMLMVLLLRLPPAWKVGTVVIGALIVELCTGFGKPDSISMLGATGLLAILALLGVFLLRERRRFFLELLLVILCLLSPHALWGVLAVAVLLAALSLESWAGLEQPRRAYAGVISVQIIAIICLLIAHFPRLIPNTRFREQHDKPLRVAHQQVDFSDDTTADDSDDDDEGDEQ